MLVATSETAIDFLRKIFSTHGIPEVLVSDNDKKFTNAEFRTFMVYLKFLCQTMASNSLMQSSGHSWNVMVTVIFIQLHITQQPLGWQSELFSHSRIA